MDQLIQEKDSLQSESLRIQRRLQAVAEERNQLRVKLDQSGDRQSGTEEARELLIQQVNMSKLNPLWTSISRTMRSPDYEERLKY